MNKPASSLAASLGMLLTAALLGACGGESADALLASSKDFLAKNDNKSAVIQLKNALQKDPKIAEARFLLGKALLDSGDAAGAEVELRKALELKHPSGEAVPLLAQALIASGQAKKLTDEFATTELPGGEPSAKLKTLLSVAYALQGQRDQAEQALDAALAAQPDYAPAKLADARRKVAGQKPDEALAIVDEVLARNAQDHEALLLKGSLLAFKGDQEGALALYRKASEAKPDYLPARSALIGSLFARQELEQASTQIEAMKKLAPNNPQTIYFDAQARYQQKDYKAARELTQQLLKIAPNATNGLQLAGAVEFQLRSYAQAETYLGQALKQQPGLVLARKLLIASYLRTGQPAKALATLEPVRELIGKDSAFLTLAGETYLQNGDADKAADYFSRASKLEPEDARKKTALSIAHMAQGNSSAALEELQQIALSDKGTIADLVLISTYLRSKQPDKALKAIASLEKKDPDNPATHNLRGLALLAKQDIPAARQSFAKALALKPTFFPAAASLAALDLRDKKPEDARKRFESVLAADPRNVRALLALAEMKASGGGTTAEVAGLIEKAITANGSDVGARLTLVQYYLSQKENKKALTAASEAAAAIPDSPEILDALGRTQQIAGDTNQALATYGKLAALQPASPLAQMRIADIHLAARNTDEAGKSLQAALAIKPDLLEAQRGLILLALEAKKPEQALVVAREVQKQRPKEAVGLALEGDIHASAKQWPEAIASYRSALKLTPAPELAIKLYSALTASGNTAEAEKMAATWRKEQPKDIALRAHQGDLATARKDYALAAQHYRGALAIQPNNALLLNNLAWVSGQMKEAKAIEYAEKANQLAPNQPAFMDTLAVLLAQKGESAKAIELLRQALSLAPQAASIQLNLAKTLIGAGKKDEAKKELDALAKLGDKFGGQAEVSNLQKQL